MKHLNGHLLCAIDCETTGLQVGRHDIVQIAILPLDFDLNPSTKILPFEMKLKPERIELADMDAIKVNKLKLANLVLTGVEPMLAADLLTEWFEALKLPEGKRIMPLAQNWAFDKPFIEEWLGHYNFDYIFDGRYRDTMAAALYLNDKADIQTEQIQFPKVNLSYLASCLHIPIDGDRQHDALYDCMLTAKIYRTMLRVSVGII